MLNTSLEEVGSFLNKLAENSNSVYWLSAPDFSRIIYISPAYETIWGRSREALYLHPEYWIDYLHPEDIKEGYHPIHQMAERLKALGEAARYDETYRIIIPNGEIRWILDRGFPIYDENQKCIGVTGVAVDITAEKELEETLLLAKQKAEAANRAKSQFLATMSHELRTPLNGILGMAQALQLTNLTLQQGEYINLLIESGNNLLVLITDILDFAQMEACEIKLKFAPFSPFSLLNDLIKTMRYLIGEKPIELILTEKKPLDPLLIGDAFRIRQILVNLVGNAIKFTSQGYIKISAHTEQVNETTVNFIVLVEDTGIGIKPELLKSIFERFTRIDTGNYIQQYEGTGLGLAISKNLVELMSGHIQVVSTPGKGSAFTIQIPCQLKATS